MHFDWELQRVYEIFSPLYNELHYYKLQTLYAWRLLEYDFM
jgi:hypothetical protein